jgi:hypothetical protein
VVKSEVSDTVFLQVPYQSATDKMSNPFNYTMEFEDEVCEDIYIDDFDDTRDNYEAEYGVERWPQPIIVRPNISSLAKMHSRPIEKPQPLTNENLEAYEEYKKKSTDLNTIYTAKCAAAKKIMSELAALEESTKNINKWSARSSRDAQKNRLESDLALAEKKKDESKVAIETHKTSGEYLRTLINYQHRSMEIWEEIEANKREIDKLMQEAFVLIEQDMEECRAARAISTK